MRPELLDLHLSQLATWLVRQHSAEPSSGRCGRLPCSASAGALFEPFFGYLLGGLAGPAAFGLSLMRAIAPFLWRCRRSGGSMTTDDPAASAAGAQGGRPTSTGPGLLTAASSEPL